MTERIRSDPDPRWGTVAPQRLGPGVANKQSPRLQIELHGLLPPSDLLAIRPEISREEGRDLGDHLGRRQSGRLRWYHPEDRSLHRFVLGGIDTRIPALHVHVQDVDLVHGRKVRVRAGTFNARTPVGISHQDRPSTPSSRRATQVENPRSVDRVGLCPCQHSRDVERSPKSCPQRAGRIAREVVRCHDTIDHVGEDRRPGSSPQPHRDDGPLPSSPDRSIHSADTWRGEERRGVMARHTSGVSEDSGTISETNSSGFHTSPIMPTSCDIESPRTVVLTRRGIHGP